MLLVCASIKGNTNAPCLHEPKLQHGTKCSLSARVETANDTNTPCLHDSKPLKRRPSSPSGSLQAQFAVKSNALLKSVANPQGPLVQDNSGNMPAALQQIQARTVSLGATQKSLPMDPSSIYGQAILQSKFRLSSAGDNT
ncbi:hypothetical protein FF1_003805 [Malus domestica]